MKKLYIIKSEPTGCPVGKNKRSLFSTYWIRSSFTDVTRFNLLQALAVWVYLKITHRWMGCLVIKKVPFYWWEVDKFTENSKIELTNTTT